MEGRLRIRHERVRLAGVPRPEFHFFKEDELELDLDPETIDENGLKELVDFMMSLGGLLGKDVVLTYENAPTAEILRYVDATGLVSVGGSDHDPAGAMSAARAFVCVSCREPQLRVVASLDIGGDRSSDEVAIQAVECSDCGFQGIAAYEESRRGATESWHHTGYQVSRDVYERVMLDLQAKSPGGLSDYLSGGEPSFHMHTATSTGDAYDGER